MERYRRAPCGREDTGATDAAGRDGRSAWSPRSPAGPLRDDERAALAVLAQAGLLSPLQPTSARHR